MLIEQNDIDLSILYPYFTEDESYSKKTCLAELKQWQVVEPDFLVLLHKNLDSIDGFLIAHRVRDTLWIHQSWHRNEPDLLVAKQALDYASDWAYGRGMTSLTFETHRDEARAWERLGFKEYTVNLKRVI